MFCIECGTRIEEGAKFCFNCGKPVPKMKDVKQNDERIEKDNLAEEKYRSYFTCHSEEFGRKIHPWCFRDYKDYVYFTLPEYSATGKGKRRASDSEDACCLGRIHKESGHIQIMKTFRGCSFMNFSIFNDTLYLWRICGEYEEKYGVLGIDLQSHKSGVVAEFELGDGLWGLELVLKNKKGSFVYISYGRGSAYIEQEGSADRKRIDGIPMLDGSMCGYNEDYLYYYCEENEQYYCIELDTLNAHNLSVENEMIIAERQIDFIDCKRDIIYLKNEDGSLTALDWQNNEVWGVEAPDITPLNSDGRSVRKWFNGKYWICLVLPGYETTEGAFIGIACYNEYGEMLASGGRGFKGSPEGGQVLFAYDEIICAGTEVIGLGTKEYLMTFIPEEAYDRFYTLYHWHGEKLESGKRAIREAFC